MAFSGIVSTLAPGKLLHQQIHLAFIRTHVDGRLMNCRTLGSHAAQGNKLADAGLVNEIIATHASQIVFYLIITCMIITNMHSTLDS